MNVPGSCSGNGISFVFLCVYFFCIALNNPDGTEVKTSPSVIALCANSEPIGTVFFLFLSNGTFSVVKYLYVFFSALNTSPIFPSLLFSSRSFIPTILKVLTS